MKTKASLDVIPRLRQFTSITIIAMCAWSGYAQVYLSVSSSTDGNGLFSYTFDLGSAGYVWGVSTNSGGVTMPVYGIENIVSPSGWAATIGANDLVTWRPTEATAYLGQPSVTFSVQSIYTGVADYDQAAPSSPYYEGAVVGAVYTASDHQFVAGGYQTFSFLGPEIVPEPTTLTLLSLAGCLFVPFTKRSLTHRSQRRPAIEF